MTKRELNASTLFFDQRVRGLALLFTLTCLCVGYNIQSQSYSSSSSSGGGTSISTTGSGDSQTIEVKLWNAGLTAELRSQGQIILSENEQNVVDIQPQGYLRIKEKSDSTVREMEWKREGTGDLTRRYRVDGELSELDEQGEAWLGKSLHRMIHETPIGAEPRAKRLLEHGGSEKLLAEIPELKNGNLQEIYFRVLASTDDLSSAMIVEAAKLVASNVSSPSSQEDVLVELGSRLTADEDVSL